MAAVAFSLKRSLDDFEDGEVLPTEIEVAKEDKDADKKLKRRHRSSRDKEGEAEGKHKHRHKGKHRHHRKRHRHEKEDKEEKQSQINGKLSGGPEEREEGQISDDGIVNHGGSEPESGELAGYGRNVEEVMSNGVLEVNSVKGAHHERKHQLALWKGTDGDGERDYAVKEKNDTKRKEQQGKATKEGSPGKLKSMLDIAIAYDDTSEEEKTWKVVMPLMEVVKGDNGTTNGLERHQVLKSMQKDDSKQEEDNKDIRSRDSGHQKLLTPGERDNALTRKSNRDSGRADEKGEARDRKMEKVEPKSELKEKYSKHRDARELSDYRAGTRDGQRAKDEEKRTSGRKEHRDDSKKREQRTTDDVRRGDLEKDEIRGTRGDSKSTKFESGAERHRVSESRKRRERSWDDDRGEKRSSDVKGSSRSPDSRHERRQRDERVGRSTDLKLETSSRFKEEALGSRRASVERRRRSRSRDRRSRSRDRRSRSRDSLRKEAGQRGDSEREARASRQDSRFEGGADRDRKDGRFHDTSRVDHLKHDRVAAHSPRLKNIPPEGAAAPEEEENAEYLERVTSQLAAQDDADDVEKIKEESRRRRQAILEKYRQQQAGGNGGDTGRTAGTGEVTTASPARAQSGSTPTSPSGNVGTDADMDAPFPSWGEENFVKLSRQQPHDVVTAVAGSSPQAESAPDIFEDDIFGESPAGGRRKGKGDGVTARITSALTDNWDDAEGYYCSRIGEVLGGRYEVIAMHGRGVFSTVVRARDLQAGRSDLPEVAIKLIRNNETMYKAGLKELVVLQKLSGQDPDNRRHCVKLVTSFEYRNHLCLVFESLHMNLREVLKKFGRNIGINLQAVRAYATQLFIALKHLRNCGVLHADIKPDNMLVNESKNTLKLADFGSAMFAGENEITPYLVSRFYRAPEIILGLPYDHALDMWSVGCCLYELYTGKMLFPGHTNNDMLRMHMELKGLFPKKMLKKAQFADQHFDQDFNFMALEEDPVTKKAARRVITSVKPKDMGSLLAGPGTVEDDKMMLANFKDILEKIFMLDPDKRLTVSQALNHPFISGK